MTGTLTVSPTELDRLLAAGKERFPALAPVREVRLESAVGVRLKLDSPVGEVDVKVELRIEGG